MKIIDRYIFFKIISTFVFVVIGLLAIICMIDYTEKYDDFMLHNLPASEIIRYFLTFIPYIASMLLPITAFIATILVTARLSSHTEIIAILSSGVSFRRLMFPYILSAILIGVISFYLNSYVIPEGNKFRVNFLLTYVNKPYYFNEKNIHMKVGPETYIYMNNYNNQEDVGYQVTLEKIVEQKLIEKLHTTKIQWDTATHKWKLDKWEKRIFNDDGEIFLKGESLDTSLFLQPEDFDNKENYWETLTLPELDKHIELQTSRHAEDVQVYKIEKYIRFMQPFTVIILVLMGLIVSARKSRRGTGYQIALGFLIAFLFIIFFVLVRAVAISSTTFSPIIAVWLPNITFSLVTLIMYYTVPR